MKKIIFCTNLPSPYRVDFFNELGKYCDLTVLYERKSSSERNDAWKGKKAVSFNEVFLNLKPLGVDRARGSAMKDYIKEHDSDILVLTNYVSPAAMEAILWCRLHKLNYYIEYDGGFHKKDPFLKGILKRLLLKGAIGHLTTADEHIKYLMSLGIKKDVIFKYPFTSISQGDIQSALEHTEKGRGYYRNFLAMKEEKVVVAIGQFIYRKGYDVLIRAASEMDRSIGFYIIGGEPTQEYLQMKDTYNLSNLHFVGFKSKTELSFYYLAADCVAFPTREDIWGLITNEALSFGVPVVATNRCISALEMIQNGQNGYVVPVEDHKALADKINKCLHADMFCECISSASRFTIENMVNAHIQHWGL